MPKSLLEIAKQQDFPCNDLVLKEIYQESISDRSVFYAVSVAYAYGVIQGKRTERSKRKGVVLS